MTRQRSVRGRCGRHMCAGAGSSSAVKNSILGGPTQMAFLRSGWHIASVVHNSIVILPKLEPTIAPRAPNRAARESAIDCVACDNKPMLSPAATACSTMDTQHSPPIAGTIALISVLVHFVAVATFLPNTIAVVASSVPNPVPWIAMVSPVFASFGVILVITAPDRGCGWGSPAVAVATCASAPCKSRMHASSLRLSNEIR